MDLKELADDGRPTTALLLRPLLVLPTLGWRQRQLRNPGQESSLLRRKLAEAAGLDGPLPCLRRHRAQRADRVLHCLTPFRRKTLKLRVELPRLLFLRGSEVLPGLHAIQNALLPLRRQAAEMFQTLPQPLLPLRRQVAELGIIFQRLLLLLRRKIFVLAQPLTGVMSLRLALLGRLPLFPATVVAAVLCHAGRGACEHERQASRCRRHRHGL